MEWWLPLSFFLIALLYSNAGFGGGSSYLALLALTAATTDEIRTTALLCNVVVVAIGSAQFYSKGMLDLRRILPLIALSVPAAFLGALVRLEERTFFLLLGVVLCMAAVAMLFQPRTMRAQREGFWHWSGSTAAGGSVGFLSGLVGIGGGIFLSPILHFTRWADAKAIAAAASSFILVNSLAGLGGRVADQSFELLPSWFWLVVLVMIGGWAGNRMVIRLGNPRRIRVVTAVLVAAVGVRLLLKYF